MNETRPILQVDGLEVSFTNRSGTAVPVKNVTFSVSEGETLCLVGPSGCGKSVTSLALLGLLPPNGAVTGGEIWWDGVPMAYAGRRDWRAVRRNCAAILFQEPAAALDPVRTVGWQIEEVLRLGENRNRAAVKQEMLTLLREVGFPAPERQSRAYPHQLSGGMCQRAMLAMALASRPRLLIADEPTTALDTTIQAQILELLRREQEKRHMALLLITHDMGVVASMADRVAVMEGGCTVEEGTVRTIFRAPQHPQTKRLLSSAGVTEGGQRHEL